MPAAFGGYYGVPPGADFPTALVAGLSARFVGHPPEALARVTLYLNTQRMRRRVIELFEAGEARLLPRIRLVTDLARETAAGLPPAVPPLRRALELARLTAALIAREPDLAPRAAAFDLATSLAALIDEMQGEGVSLAALEALDISDLSGHWARSLRFLRLVGGYLDPDPSEPVDAEARRRRVVEVLADRWATAPPPGPVILAGSTGSRGTTRRFMEAVAALPQGAVVLPGLDQHLPQEIWRALQRDRGPEDHPQFRFATLTPAPWAIPTWHGESPDPARARLVSMALRPAPVTDSWRRDAPSLGDLAAATAGLTLIEARELRQEALALALQMRAALERGQTVALITPDRGLGRRVSAALDRWGLIADDSAGVPLGQTAAGRLARLLAGRFGQPLTGEALIALLTHPLVAAGPGRSRHLRLTRRLERHLRRHGPPLPDAASLRSWADGVAAEDGPALNPNPWVEWVIATLCDLSGFSEAPLGDHVGRLQARLQRLASGPEGAGATAPAFSDSPADQEAARRLAELAEEAAAVAGPATPADLRAVLDGVLAGEVRDAAKPDGRVMIWGTLEARVQGADLVLLGGLNDGVWPELPGPDPWLNRRLRRDAGLLSPERSVGLAAHDFEQAIGAAEVVLSRALRDGEAKTVPSRWLNRLTTLLAGLPDQRGDAALAAMRDRGAPWLAWAEALDAPAQTVPAAPRPAPCPPPAHRPRELPVTRIETLIRDPYAIYAERILRLCRLDPLRRGAEARDRGTALPRVLARAVPALNRSPRTAWAEILRCAGEEMLAREVPWPVARRLWLARLSRIAPKLLEAEAKRLAHGQPELIEQKGALDLSASDFRLTATCDRIDRLTAGGVALYDYKAGQPPSAAEERAFRKQLLLTALIVERGGFEALGPQPVAAATYLGLNAKLAESAVELTPPAQTADDLARLIAHYDVPEHGYTAQTAPQSERFDGDYLHLSRAGEWTLGDAPRPERVGW